MSYDVLMAETEPTMRSLAKQAATTSNVTVRFLLDDRTVTDLPEQMRGALPSAVSISSAGVKQRVALGAVAYAKLLAQP